MGDAGPAGSGGGGAAPSDAGDDAGMSAILGATPPMGWNSWNTFQCNMDETLIKQIADVIVSSGMQAAGYQYVNLDDCWMDGRDSERQAALEHHQVPVRHPRARRLRSRQGSEARHLRGAERHAPASGIYGGISHSVAVGSLGHETTDAQTFASWGVDYLKYDLCAGQR